MSETVLVQELAITPLTDVRVWARGDGLLIVLAVLGALLAARFVAWLGHRITGRIDAGSQEGDALVRSESAKHRHSVAQVLSGAGTALIWSVAAVFVLD